MKLDEKITLVLLIWNVMVFLIYGIDKSKARKGAWRIPEKIFIIICHSFLVDLVLGWQVLPFTTRLENGILKRFGS